MYTNTVHPHINAKFPHKGGLNKKCITSGENRAVSRRMESTGDAEKIITDLKEIWFSMIFLYRLDFYILHFFTPNVKLFSSKIHPM